jgi:hypothetical protein
MEAGLRIAPDQWSSLLYGDTNHKSHMQSIIDKVRISAVLADLVTPMVRLLKQYSVDTLFAEIIRDRNTAGCRNLCQ